MLRICKIAVGAAVLAVLGVPPALIAVMQARAPGIACARWGEHYKVKTTLAGSDCLVEGGLSLAEIQAIAGPHFYELLPPPR